MALVAHGEPVGTARRKALEQQRAAGARRAQNDQRPRDRRPARRTRRGDVRRELHGGERIGLAGCLAEIGNRTDRSADQARRVQRRCERGLDEPREIEPVAERDGAGVTRRDDSASCGRVPRSGKALGRIAVDGPGGAPVLLNQPHVGIERLNTCRRRVRRRGVLQPAGPDRGELVGAHHDRKVDRFERQRRIGTGNVRDRPRLRRVDRASSPRKRRCRPYPRRDGCAGFPRDSARCADARCRRSRFRPGPSASPRRRTGSARRAW